MPGEIEQLLSMSMLELCVQTENQKIVAICPAIALPNADAVAREAISTIAGVLQSSGETGHTATDLLEASSEQIKQSITLNNDADSTLVAIGAS